MPGYGVTAVKVNRCPSRIGSARPRHFLTRHGVARAIPLCYCPAISRSSWPVKYATTVPVA